ncbi:DUF2283 domain-containing protein [bacterium (Candidatus Gribaldobacteria) CG23_combo_of_CG06-09_8_20_14_all_37_87_8]|uniref:DUF2283 domain-containing protein n=2 Tax=Candidatus Gribaldobacteria TaxID=2798536 RepID=A0A2G9ZEW5_9BACT|nr:MAG: DUF2283 domain-containing protein [bacterium (Candidatus Gribaldobacteria) CG23_combo_of_CG06-09_8_20_14_all_37_87_8]PIR90008.1 MAG: DUF2283 domain-containing protein [bacterium (Candidatus Gribaldobacteria) CG10_big_fil_rev_8_21_14_0_10_37_21]
MIKNVNMKIQYDKIADAMYIYFKKGAVAQTKKISNRVLLDLDKEGNVLGMELLVASSQMSKKEIGKVSFEAPVYA